MLQGVPGKNIRYISIGYLLMLVIMQVKRSQCLNTSRTYCAVKNIGDCFNQCLQSGETKFSWLKLWPFPLILNETKCTTPNHKMWLCNVGCRSLYMSFTYIACEFWWLACLIKHASFYKEVKNIHSSQLVQFDSVLILESQVKVIPSENATYEKAFIWLFYVRWIVTLIK